MTDVGPTHKDRALAAAAGISATPGTTPPETPTRRNSDTTKNSEYSFALPVSAYTIIFVEGCERFCYYGLKAVLLLYFMNFLHLSKDSATAGYHLFSFACYFAPTVGAIISDGYIGRYWTIVILSIVYFIGTSILTLTAIPAIGGKQLIGPIFGLLFISFGTGGIKPCVSAFGADQISISNTKALSRYFSFFYFAINVGSVLSTIITPLLRSHVHCFGYDCYTLAFGVPAILMLTSIIIFLAGTSFYKRIPPKENIIIKFIAVIFRAIKNALCSPSRERREHWIYYADDKYNNYDMEDVRTVLRVFLLFVPIPIYFALYDQSGSRWTYQASIMDGSLGALGTIEPDQMQALNSILVLLFIPLFEELIYPAFARCNILVKPLHRMICGMMIMILAFVAAGGLQIAIEVRASSPYVRTQTKIFNGYDCPISFNSVDKLAPKNAIEIPCSTLLDKGLIIRSSCDNEASFNYKLTINQTCPSGLIISKSNDATSGKALAVTTLEQPIKSSTENPQYGSLRVISLDGKQKSVMTEPNANLFEIKEKLIPTDYKHVLRAQYRIKDTVNNVKSVEKFQISTAALFTVLLYSSNDTKLHAVLFEDYPSLKVHMLWQSIQYVLLTVSEILVSITGLMFAYSQSPKRYKSVIMSAWLITTAVGDLIVVIVAEVHLTPNQAMEFFLFAGFMAIATAFFSVLASFYREFKPHHRDTEDQHLITGSNPIETEDGIQLSK